MAVGGDDDTHASSVPTIVSASPVPDPSELVSGRYQIIRWLGGGGMGRVYEVFDTELEERVALKVLRAELSDDAIERFKREVKLTRRIQHRNVARMFDIGEHKGEKYLTMELVDGEPLSRRLGNSPMLWPELKAIAEQICAGLSAAHAAGVIHRDLKPDNVLVEKSTERAVLTDFGIARSGDDPSVTQVGAVVGTPRYMAPEQLAGTEIDARADLFSLGVMLFELATGMRPWPGDNAIAIAVSQATTSPRTIDSATGAIPPFFAAIVAACLQLEPKHRPATAAEIGAAIASGVAPVMPQDKATKAHRPRATDAPPRRPTPIPASPTPAEPASIAVLPLTCAPADEYLADGVLEDLIDTLSTTPGLRVRPSGTARSTTPQDPRELGHRLGVDHVVVGSMRRTPSGLRIATRLISVADGFQIWAHKADCAEAEVLSVAGDLAHGVAAALSSRATSVTKPTDPRAVDCYLRARAELRRFWGSHAQNAADLLEQAVEYAPTSAPILGAYAFACVQAWVMRGDPDLLPRAEAALERGLSGGHGEAFLASAQHLFQRNEPERAAADLARALIRAPMSAQSHELAGKILVEIEGPAIARQHYETARGLDPGRSQIIDNDLARIDALEHLWVDSDRRIATLIADPDTSIAQLGYISRARLDVWRGSLKLATSAQAFLTRVSVNAGSIFKVIAEIDRAGGIEQGLWDRTVRAPIPPNAPVRQYIVRMQIFAELALGLDQRELGLEAFAKAVELGLMDVTWTDNCPLLDQIVEHKDFKELRRAVSERASRVLAAFRNATAGA